MLGRLKNGGLDVLDGFKSYDSYDDDVAVPGASGGAVLNSKGQLIGLSVRGTAPNDLTPAPEIEKQLNIHLKGSHDNDLLQQEILQPVTNSLVNTLTHKLDTVVAGSYE